MNVYGIGEFVNLTPHAVVFRRVRWHGEVVDEVCPPSGSVARVASKPGEMRVNGVYYAPVWGDVEGLPEPEGGVAYLVSAIVAARCPHRVDVFSPGTGPSDEAIRDEAGHIVAVTRLISSCPAPVPQDTEESGHYLDDSCGFSD